MSNSFNENATAIDSGVKLSQLEQTALDSICYKVSCVEKGYLPYPKLMEYIACFPHGFIDTREKSPMIRRGYYARMYSIRTAISQFLNNQKDCCTEVQIVNIGSGFDPLHLYIDSLASVPNHKLRVIDVDTENIVRICSEYDYISGITKLTHKRIAADFNDTDNLNRLVKMLDLEKRTTLFICECVLTYLSAETCSKLIRALLSSKNQVHSFVCFDVFNTKDRFGQMMKHNFELVGSPIGVADQWESTSDVKNFFADLLPNQLNEAIETHTLNEIYTKINQTEQNRIAAVEALDELEEIKLIEEHAMVCTINLQIF